MGVNAPRASFCVPSQHAAIIYKADILILSPFLYIWPFYLQLPFSKKPCLLLHRGRLLKPLNKNLSFLPLIFTFTWKVESHPILLLDCCNEEVYPGQLPLAFSKICPITFNQNFIHPFCWLLPSTIWTDQVSSTLNQFFSSGPSFSYLYTQTY